MPNGGEYADMENQLAGDFDESDYLLANPDVARAVAEGQFRHGLEHYKLYGKAEGRRLYPPQLSRNEKVLYGLNSRGKGLEIGPSHNPIAPKVDGFDVEILDHLDADGLRAKYRSHNIAIERIEEVDYVWSGEPLSDLIGKEHHYDWIIASHVIEHVPDMVTFLQHCEILLKTDGKLSLVIPDKRYCFDCFRPLTSTGEVLDAYIEKRTRASPGRVFDFVANTVRLGGDLTWSAHKNTDVGLELIHTFSNAQLLWNTATENAEYIDIHNWCFIPSSFKLLLADLNTLGLTGLTVTNDFDTEDFEFFVTLSRGEPTIDSRLTRLIEIRRDTRSG